MKNELTELTFEILVIDVIESIQNDLERGKFRDCDIPWLNKKLHVYTKLAMDSLGIHLETPSIEGRLNDYNSDRLQRYFKTLLEYFRSIES